MSNSMIDYETKRAGSMGLHALVKDDEIKELMLEWHAVGRFFRVGEKWSLHPSDAENLDYSEPVFINPKLAIEFIKKWDTEDSELNDEIEYYTATDEQLKEMYPELAVDYFKSMTAASGEGCPPATQDIMINLENRKKAINNVGYGPMNPDRPNVDFWEAKADLWGTTPDEAKTSRCANCAMFVRTSRMLECIEAGLTQEENEEAWGSIDAGSLGYCEAFDFKCAAGRTCDAWVAGGPVTDKDEED